MLNKKKFNLYSIVFASVLGWGIAAILLMFFGHDLSDLWPNMIIGFMAYCLSLSIVLYLTNKIK